MANTDWKQLLIEFLGTFTLVLIITAAVALTIEQGYSVLGAAFAYGLALMVLIYVWPASGAHFNPAVSLGFAVAGQMNWLLMIGYWIAQLVGGIAAAALVAWWYGTSNGAGASVGFFTNTEQWKAFLIEAFITFFLVIAYLFLYRNPMLSIISGLAIGLTLTFSFIAFGPATGASANPARSLGPAIFGNTLGSYWIYIVGPLVGAFVAAIVYRLFTYQWGCCTKRDECGNAMRDECGNVIKECKRPIYDECGKVVTDCCGPLMETYETVDVKHGYKQETPLSAVGAWMSTHGMDPKFLAHEMKEEYMMFMKETPKQTVAKAKKVTKKANKTARNAISKLMAPSRY